MPAVSYRQQIYNPQAAENFLRPTVPFYVADPPTYTTQSLAPANIVVGSSWIENGQRVTVISIGR
jgi:hypothetical protein